MTLIENASFEAWFSGSKVRDWEGNPLVVYHGSGKNFDHFEHGHSNGWTNKRAGFYFTDEEEIAREFGRVRAFYLAIKHPADFRDGDGQEIVDAVLARDPEMKAKVGAAIENEYGPEITSWRMGSLGYLQTDEFVGHLAALGFDGMLIDDKLGMGGIFTSYVAFSPSQIRPVSAQS